MLPPPNSPSFCSWKFYWLHTLHYADHLHLFHLDSATIAIWPDSFYPIILITPHQAMIYADIVDFHVIQLLEIKSLYNKLLSYSFTDSLWFCNHQITISITVSSSSTVFECHLLSINTWSIRWCVFHQEKSKHIYECCNVGTLYSWQLDFLTWQHLLF